ASAGGRLPWQGRWGVLYLVAVGGWVWREALAPVAPALLLVLVVLVLVLPLCRRAASARWLPHHRNPNGPAAD
ncbi:hypothetical protein, partial [Streptomyces sp. NRRL S-481]